MTGVERRRGHGRGRRDRDGLRGRDRLGRDGGRRRHLGRGRGLRGRGGGLADEAALLERLGGFGDRRPRGRGERGRRPRLCERGDIVHPAERLHGREDVLVVGEQVVEGPAEELVDVVVGARDLRGAGGGRRGGLGLGRRGRRRGREGDVGRGLVGHAAVREVEVVDDDAAPRLGGRRRLEGDEGADVLEQLAERDRFVDVVLRPRPELAVLLEGLLAGLARHDDERHVLELRILLQLVADREPVHPGQLDRQEDEVGPIRGGDLQADVAVVHDLDGGAGATELGAELSGERRVAFSGRYEDFGVMAMAGVGSRRLPGRAREDIGGVKAIGQTGRSPSGELDGRGSPSERRRPAGIGTAVPAGRTPALRNLWF